MELMRHQTLNSLYCQPVMETDKLSPSSLQKKKKKNPQQGRQGALTLTHWSGPTPLTVMVVSGLSSRTFSLQHLASSLVQTLMGTIQLGHSSPGRHTHTRTNQKRPRPAAPRPLGQMRQGWNFLISFCSVQCFSFTNLCILFMCRVFFNFSFNVCVLTLCSVSLSFYLLPGILFYSNYP